MEIIVFIAIILAGVLMFGGISTMRPETTRPAPPPRPPQPGLFVARTTRKFNVEFGVDLLQFGRK